MKTRLTFKGLIFKSFFLKTLLTCILSLVGQQAFAACDCGSSDSANPCTGKSLSVEVTGQKDENYRKVAFNWGFSSGGQDAYCGQFANGDYWIAPNRGSNEVTLNSLSISGSGSAYLDENPTIDGMGFLTKDYGNLVASQNLINSLPKAFPENTSLVSVAQRNESQNGCGTGATVGSCVDAYNVVTVLESIPQNAGSTVLRPNISRETKDLLSWNDFDLTRFSFKDFLEGEDADGLEVIRQTWSHHIETLALQTIDGSYFSEGGRGFRADLVTDDYAATVAQHWHRDLMTILSSKNTLASKQQALAAMLTYGKDIFFAAYDDNGDILRTYGSGAGQWLGRFPAATLFGAIAIDNQYARALSNSVSRLREGKNDIQELSQLHRGPNGPVWGDQRDIYTQRELGRYWEEMLAYKAFEGASGVGKKVGQKTSRDPYQLIDGPGAYPGTLYAAVSAGPIKAFAAAMFLIPQMCEIVTNNDIVEYSIRITDDGIQTDRDICAPPDPREISTCSTYFAKGCKYYGLSNEGTATWGPDPSDLTQCIKNGTDPITGKPQTGRFSSKHGEDFTIQYSVPQVERNWAAIVAGRDSCRTIKKPLPPTGFQVVPK